MNDKNDNEQFLRLLRSGHPCVHVVTLDEDYALSIVREAALEHGRPGEAYNIGTGVGLDNQDVLELLERTSSPEVGKIEVVREPPRPFDVLENVLSSARLTEVSGWRPEVEAPEGFRRTWDWVEAQQQGRAG